ncbi:MAG: hypothetical protein ABIQ01_06440 [Pseudolysinimonas sp.]
MNRRSVVFAFALAGPLLLVACTATTPVPTPEPTSAAPADLNACLVGDWTADADLPGEFMEHLVLDQLSQVPNGPTAVRADGTISLAFEEDGTFEYAPNITFEIDYPLAGTEPGDLSGSTTGTWRTVDDLLVSTVVQTDVMLRLGMGGEPEPFNGIRGWENLPIGASTVSCDGDRLAVEFLLGDTALPMEFGRAI